MEPKSAKQTPVGRGSKETPLHMEWVNKARAGSVGQSSIPEEKPKVKVASAGTLWNIRLNYLF